MVIITPSKYDNQSFTEINATKGEIITIIFSLYDSKYTFVWINCDHSNLNLTNPFMKNFDRFSFKLFFGFKKASY